MDWLVVAWTDLLQFYQDPLLMLELASYAWPPSADITWRLSIPLFSLLCVPSKAPKFQGESQRPLFEGETHQLDDREAAELGRLGRSRISDPQRLRIHNTFTNPPQLGCVPVSSALFFAFRLLCEG